MNSVLKEILETKQVSDGRETLPLRSQMDQKQGALLANVFGQIQPTTSLEVGFAYGLSTLYICEALEKLNRPARHIVIDPFQTTQWRGIGLRNVTRAGYDKFVELHEQKSEIALPQLLAQGTVLDVALIDGWHTFDHALVDFFYINKMLHSGGVVVLDDATYPSVAKLVDHILTYGCYRIFAMPVPPTTLMDAHAFLFVRRLAYYARLKRTKWPRAIALQKIAPDERSHNWYKSF